MRKVTSALMCAALGLGAGLGSGLAMATTASKDAAKTSKASKTSSKASSQKAKSSKSANKTSSKAKTQKIPAPISQSAQDAAEAASSDAVLGEKEMQFAKWVDQGTFSCDEGGAVTLTAQSDKPGYFILTNRGQHYRVSPRVSITGAVRLESNAGGIVWLQLANKSMLIAPKQSRRLADGCMSESQKVIAAEMLRNPSPSLFDDGKAQPSAPALAAAAPAAVHEPKNQAMPVLRLVEVPATVANELPSKRSEQDAAAIMSGQ